MIPIPIPLYLQICIGIIIVSGYIVLRVHYLCRQFDKIDKWYATYCAPPTPRFVKIFERYDNNIDSVAVATFRLIFFLRPRDRHQQAIDLRNKILSRADNS